YKGSTFEGFKGFDDDSSTPSTSAPSNVQRNADGSTTINGITLKPKTGTKYASLGNDVFANNSSSSKADNDDFGSWQHSSSPTNKSTQLPHSVSDLSSASPHT